MKPIFHFFFHEINVAHENGEPIIGCLAKVTFQNDSKIINIPFTIGNFGRTSTGNYNVNSCIFRPGYGASCENESRIFSDREKAKRYLSERGEELIRKYYLD